jgi:hypothetical protein
MKLNITNYNENFDDDINELNKISELIDLLKNNIKGKHYIPYQNFLKKMIRFLNMVYVPFEKELEVYKKSNNDYEQDIEQDNEQDNQDDNISIGSISEYENDENEPIYIDENILINNFELNTKSKLEITNNRYEFICEKIYE